MIDENLSNQLKQLVESARTVFVLFPSTANVDHLATAAALFTALKNSQKSVALVTPQPREVTTDTESIVGLDQVQCELGNQNLSISFPYSPDQVDKVSYHIGEETKRFFLSIKPKSGIAPLDANQVEFTYTGASADVVFLVGVKELEELEQLYFGYEQLYQDTPTVSINSYATAFGTYKLDTGTASSSSEVLAQLLPALDLSLDSDNATTLLYGIESSTKQLTAPTASAETFETVAQLLRAGARRSFKRSSGEERVVQNPQESIVHQTAVLQDESGGVTDVSVPKKLVDESKKKTVKAKAAKKEGLEPPADYVPSKLM